MSSPQENRRETGRGAAHAPHQIGQRYRMLQHYVQWSEDDRRNVMSARELLGSSIDSLVEDFFAAVLSHPIAASFITGGVAQVVRLKATLRQWLQKLLAGSYDESYAVSRWNVGRRHVEIGLDQIFTHAAMSRLRTGILDAIQASDLPDAEKLAVMRSFSRLLDMDLAIIEDAYQLEYLARQEPVNEARMKQQGAVTQISRRALDSEQLDPLFHYAVALTADVLRADQCVLLQLSEDGQSLVPRAFFGWNLDEVAEVKLSASSRFLAGRTLSSDIPLAVTDHRQLGEVAVDELPHHEQVMASLSVPVFSGGATWGVLVVHTFAARRFEQADEDCLQSVANVLSATIDRHGAQQRVIQQERLAGIGQMMTGIAHESRNALQRIQACTEMLEMEVPPDSEAMYLVSRIERAQDDLNRMFNEVRSYASAIRLELVEGDVSTVWHEAWEQIEGERRRRDARLTTRRCVRPLQIRMDRYRLIQVFRNLFENALSICHDPVCIDVSCRRVRFNQEAGVEIVVSDNGPGFDEASRRRAFDPFFTTKTKGTGLGLAIAQRIVEAHGGSIAIAPARGVGAEFIIRLPLSS